ncbi:hypothetical protein [Methanolobus psychrotolerans]|uniref:hypothetical protein n=1 Tax=Methanolobus psychrotolerans TaxID=1874706 RepID=UPI000B919618|nr:hypothetical protein [Methanolobus psychrotolerans]
MASRRSRGRGVTPGTVRGTDKNWLSDGMDERRQNHAEDFCKSALGQCTTCKVCGSKQARCVDARVTDGNGATSSWRCDACGQQFIRNISPEKMAQYYQEDLHVMLTARKAQEANA